MAKVFPAVEELDHLPEPLNVGEHLVLNSLRALDDRWSIYVQPRFGQDQPDFVLLHPDYGVCAIEVKDWALGIYRQAANGVTEVRCNDGWRATSEAPRYQASRYRNVIFERFFATADDSPIDPTIVRAIVVMPRYTTPEAVELLCIPRISASAEKRIDVRGGNALVNALLPVVTGQVQPRARKVPKDAFDRLRRFLAIGEDESDQRLPLSLSTAAMNIEKNPSNARIRRVRGSAGCGKSLGLAARAARLAAEGKQVLVVTFNSTLPHYLHSLAARRCREVDANVNQITFTHIHGLCKRAIDDFKMAGGELEASTLPGTTPWHEQMVDNAVAVYEAGHGQRFDAVLVDEGQDFNLKWWNFLRRYVCQPDGEMLLVADPTQDLYDRRAWTDEDKMLGAGFSGQWAEPRGSYRMPPDLTPLVAKFAELHVPGSKVEPVVPTDHPFTDRLFTPTVRRWVDSNFGDVIGTMIGNEVLQLLEQNPDLAPSDVVFLAPSHEVGLQAVSTITRAGFEVNHIFGANRREQSRRKDLFWPSSPGIKGCTPQSFKGWEARAVVLSVGSSDMSRRLAYVGMTRVKGDPAHRAAFVTVVNTDQNLRGFRADFEY